MSKQRSVRSWYRIVAETIFGFGIPETRGERIRFCLFKLFVLGFAVGWAWQWGVALQGIPGVLVPLGVARDVDISFLFEPYRSFILAGAITGLAVVALFGRWERVALPMLVILLHLQYVARHSLGKAAHGSHYVGLALLMLAVAAWVMPTPQSRRRFALHATAFCMGLGYVSAGLCKMSNTGLSWPCGEHLWLWIGEKGVDKLSSGCAMILTPLQEICLSHRNVATAFLSMGLVTELLGFLFWFRRTRGLMALALLGLHGGIALTLGIVFDAYMYQIAIVGLPIPAFLDGVLARRANSGLSSSERSPGTGTLENYEARE